MSSAGTATVYLGPGHRHGPSPTPALQYFGLTIRDSARRRVRNNRETAATPAMSALSGQPQHRSAPAQCLRPTWGSHTCASKPVLEKEGKQGGGATRLRTTPAKRSARGCCACAE